jgi:hypothetical protein
MEPAARHQSLTPPRKVLLTLGVALLLLLAPSGPTAARTIAGAFPPPSVTHGSPPQALGAVVAQTGSTAMLTIFTSLTTPSGQPASGPLAGYSYTITGQSSLPTQTIQTNQVGQASIAGLPAGIYSISETPLAGSSFGSMTINGVSALQQQPFQVQAGGNYVVNVTNIVSGPANVTIQVQALDPNGQPVSGTNLSGYTFTFTGQGGQPTSPTTVSSANSGQATANLSPGAYTITESAAPGATLITYTINGVPTQTGQFTVGVGQATSIMALNRVSTSTAGGGLRTVSLSTGCNNVASTFPDATTGQVLASAVSPSTSVAAIWRFDNMAQTFRAVFFPPVGAGVAPPVDVSAISRLDAVFICAATPAILTEPAA